MGIPSTLNNKGILTQSSFKVNKNDQKLVNILQKENKMNFTALKPLKERQSILQYFANIRLRRSDTNFNYQIRAKYNSGSDTHTKKQIKSIQNSVLNELSSQSGKKLYKKQDKLEYISIIIGNLIAAQGQAVSMYLKYSCLSKTEQKKMGAVISPNSRYLENRPVSRSIIKIIDTMESMNLIEVKRGHFSLKNESGNKTIIKAAGELFKLVKEMNKNRLTKSISVKNNEEIRKYKTIKTKNKEEKIYMDYNDDKYINEIREKVKAINENNRKSIYTSQNLEALYIPAYYEMSDSGDEKLIDFVGENKLRHCDFQIDGCATSMIKFINLDAKLFYHSTGIRPGPFKTKIGLQKSGLKKEHFDVINKLYDIVITGVILNKMDIVDHVLRSIFFWNQNQKKLIDEVLTERKGGLRKLIFRLAAEAEEKHSELIKAGGRVTRLKNNFILNFRLKLAERTALNKERRLYVEPDEHFSYRKHGYSHFEFNDLIICKKGHTNEIADIGKALFRDKHDADIDIEINNFAKENKAFYNKIKDEYKFRERKLSIEEVAKGKKAYIRTRPYRYLDKLGIVHEVSHKELVNAVMQELDCKDRKARTIIKNLKDDNILVSGGTQRNRIYSLSENAIQIGHENILSP